MANRFEDLLVWQRARELTVLIYELTARGAFSKDFGLRDQVRRAGVSVMSNIAEGFERGGNVEFARFLDIAKGSCGEVRCQLYIALDQGYLDAAMFDRASGLTIDLSRMLSAFAKKIRKPK